MTLVIMASALCFRQEAKAHKLKIKCLSIIMSELNDQVAQRHPLGKPVMQPN